MRGTAVATLIAITVLMVGALPASAAVSMTIQSPSNGQELTGSTATQVRVERTSFDFTEIAAVELRLVREGTPTSGAPLACTQGCDSNQQTWGQLQLQPSSPDEFGVSHPLANGSWTVQSRWRDGAGNWSGWGADVQITLSVPPSAVSGLAADAELRDVTLTWQRAPEPDISAYRIQRRPDGGSWSVVDSTDASASSYSETVPSAGTYEYRVVTVRPSGDGGALTATSPSVSVTATSPSPSPSPTGSSSGGDGSTGGSSDGSTGGVQQGDDTGGDTTDGGTDDGSGDATTGDPSGEPSDGSSGDDGGAGAEDTDGDDGSTSTRSSGRSRVAAPPGVRQGASLDVDADLPDPEVAPEAEERFFGEGEDFSEELEYGAVDPVLPEQESEQDAVLRRIPGGIQEYIVSRFEIRTLLTSIATGLLFMTLGLHVFRWMRATAHE